MSIFLFVCLMGYDNTHKKLNSSFSILDYYIQQINLTNGFNSCNGEKK